MKSILKIATGVNEKFAAAYVKERVDEANALQGVEAVEEFNKRLKVFYQNRRGDVMAKRM
jgi:ssDNA-specific exonuclease RecJ